MSVNELVVEMSNDGGSVCQCRAVERFAFINYNVRCGRLCCSGGRKLVSCRGRKNPGIAHEVCAIEVGNENGIDP